MEKTSAEDDASGPLSLKYKTWVLKVTIHCVGCKKKVKRVLQSIEGVYMITIDNQKHKVTVTGNVEADTLIKKLIRNGKQAEVWPEINPHDENEQKAVKNKKKNYQNQKNSEDGQNSTGLKGDTKKNSNDESQHSCEDSDDDKESPDKTSQAEDKKGAEMFVAAQNGGSEVKKKKKNNNNKGTNGNASNGDNGSPSPTPMGIMDPLIEPMNSGSGRRAVLFQYDPYLPAQAIYSAPEYGLGYNILYQSSIAPYFVPPSNYYQYWCPDNHFLPPSPFDPKFAANDTNDYDYDESGCFIM